VGGPCTQPEKALALRAGGSYTHQSFGFANPNQAAAAWKAFGRARHFVVFVV